MPSTYVTNGGMIILNPSCWSSLSIRFAAFPDHRVCSCVSKAAAGFPVSWSLLSLSRKCVMGGVALKAWVGDPAMMLS